MRNYIFFGVIWIFASATTVCAQGVFVGSNAIARTRLGSLDGPFAGTNIVGQMLGGPTPSSLQPVGPIDYHNNGEFAIAYITVPNVPPGESAYVQLMAWDSIYWGNNLAGVPNDQLGRTDIVPVSLTTGIFPDPIFGPRFTQPAIVPPIPEPSALALAIIGFGVLSLRRRQKI